MPFQTASVQAARAQVLTGDRHQRTSVGKETVPQPSVTHVWVTADVKHGLLTGPDESKDALGPGLQKCVDTTPRGTCY